jgi:hypothetical protein
VTSGTYYLLVKTDNGNGLYESNENNNILARQITIGVPDLVVITGEQTLVAETSIADIQDVDGSVVINANITGLKDAVTRSAVSGIFISCYQAITFYNPLGIEMLTVRPGDLPFDAPVFSINNLGGNTSFNQCTVSGAEPPITVAKLAPTLVGCATNSYDLTVTFASISDLNGNLIAEEAPQSLTFQRGDINGDGVVNIVDAMFGAQYLVGLRENIHQLNMASVHHNGSSGDIKNIIDCMYIAQYVVGVRDCYFMLVP